MADAIGSTTTLCPELAHAANGLPSLIGNEGDWDAINAHLVRLAALVQRTEDPETTAAYVLVSLRNRIEYNFELLYGNKRLPEMLSPQACVSHDALLEELWGGDRDPA